MTVSAKKRFLGLAMLATMALGASGAVGAHAITTEQAESNLTTGIYNKMAENEYTLEGGGSVSGRELFNKENNGSAGTSYDVNGDQFQDLTVQEQQRFTTELVENANAQVGENGVTNSTVTGLLQKLQTKPGMGSKLLTEILKNTKPDYVRANRIYEPFSGIVGTILGLGAILILAFVGIVIVTDIAFITIPPFQHMMGGIDREGQKGVSKFLVSAEAVTAVQDSQGGSRDGNGASGYRSALGIYFKRRVLAMIILGFCLLYLVQGQIYNLVGYLLDLVSGFLGF